MATEQDDTAVLNHDRRTWSIGKEIPIAVIAAVLFSMVLQTIAGVWLVRGWVEKLENRAEFQARELTQQGVKLDITNDKLDELRETVRGGNVPTAINGRRIDEIERLISQQATLIAQLADKVNENERRITLMEARGRASRERF